MGGMLSDAEPASRAQAGGPGAKGPPRWMRGRSRAVATVFLASSLGAALIGIGVVQRIRALALSSLWGLLVLLAFIGWGALFNRLAYGNTARAGWSLRAAWGMAIASVYGGILCAASLASRASLFAFACAGLLLYAWDAAGPLAEAIEQRAWVRLRATSPVWMLAALTLLVLLSVQYVGASAAYRLNLSDDLPAYAAYPRRMLESGTFIDPFSLRRMLAFGGQSFLQAFTLLAGSERNLNQFDAGLCVIVVCGLVFQESGIRARRVLAWPVLAIVLLVLMLPGQRFNLAGWMSGAVFLLATFRLLRWEPFSTSRGAANAIAMALLVAGACSLRHSYILPAVVMSTFSYGACLLACERNDGGQRSVVREWLLHVAATAVLIAPWMVLAWHSNGTPLFPWFNGNAHPEAPFFPASASVATGLERARALWAAVMRADPIVTWPLILGPALLLDDRSHRQALRSTVLGALAAVLVSAYRMATLDGATQGRPTFSAVLAAVLASLVVAMEILLHGAKRRSPSQLAAGALAALALLLQIHSQMGPTLKSFDGHLEHIWNASRDKHQALRDYRYAEMQNHVPAGAPILAMVDEVHWFDFGRNPVMSIDLPGAASPRGSFPLMYGTEAISGYLKSLGIRYVAFVKPFASKELYRRSFWHRAARQKTGRSLAPYYRAAFDYVDTVARRRNVLYDDATMCLVDLQEPAPPVPDEGDPAALDANSSIGSRSPTGSRYRGAAMRSTQETDSAPAESE